MQNSPQHILLANMSHKSYMQKYLKQNAGIRKESGVTLRV